MDHQGFHKILYEKTQKQQLKRELPESLLVQEDPEKGVRENWYKKERVNFIDKVYIMEDTCTAPDQNKMKSRLEVVTIS